jgi:hypothetical protein
MRAGVGCAEEEKGGRVCGNERGGAQISKEGRGGRGGGGHAVWGVAGESGSGFEPKRVMQELAAVIISQISPQGELEDKVWLYQGAVKALVRLC